MSAKKEQRLIDMTEKAWMLLEELKAVRRETGISVDAATEYLISLEDATTGLEQQILVLAKSAEDLAVQVAAARADLRSTREGL